MTSISVSDKHPQRYSSIMMNSNRQQGEPLLYAPQLKTNSYIRDLVRGFAPTLQHVPLLERRCSSKSHSQCPGYGGLNTLILHCQSLQYSLLLYEHKAYNCFIHDVSKS